MDQSNIQTPSLEIVVKEIAKAQDLQLHTSFPAKIKTYDPDTQKASIIPLYLKRLFLFGSGVPVLTQENIDDVSAIEDPIVIPGVPVHWPSVNNRKTFIHLPLKAGDLGMAICCERSLDKWLSSLGTDPLANDDFRHHHLSDAWFVPGISTFRAPISGCSADNITIKNENITIEVTPDGKISFTNGTAELIEALSALVAVLKTASTLVNVGAGTGIIDPATKLLIEVEETKINSFKV